MKNLLNDRGLFFWIKVSAFSIFILCTFYFLFHTRGQACSNSQDQSGNFTTLCSVENVASPYQKLILSIHKYFYKNDPCFVDFKTGDIYCQPSVFKNTQQATTTDLSKFVQVTSVQSNNAEAYSTTTWKTFKNTELGISFSYPFVKNSGEEYWGIGTGDKGKVFQATIELSPDISIYAYTTTKDYSVPKGGFNVGTEGFVVKNNKYYVVSRGSPVDTAFVPDEVWKLRNGESIPVIYKKNYDPYLDYPDPEVQVMVNMPNQSFTGIGFILWSKKSNPVSSDDILTFKKIVTSVEFIK